MEGLWRFPLDPAQGDKGSYVDRVAPNGNLVEDVEGVTVWVGPRGAGYLIVSAQGDSRFNVHDRAAPFAFRGSFRVVDNAARTIDGVSETDGVEVSSMAMGPRFPRGLLVLQDGENTLPAETQNFKYVSWADVEKVLGLAP
jgi:3-phytase